MSTSFPVKQKLKSGFGFSIYKLHNLVKPLFPHHCKAANNANRVRMLSGTCMRSCTRQLPSAKPAYSGCSISATCGHFYEVQVAVLVAGL